MKNIKLKDLLNEGKKNPKDIVAGDVFRKDAGFGMATYVAMYSIKQNSKYKNEYDVFSTVLIPGKKHKSKYNERDAEVYVTFSPRQGKFKDVEYIGKWKDIRDKYMK
jgi:hypothetical protein